MDDTRPTPGPVLSGAEADRVRTRVRLLVEITSRVDRFRGGLALAARRLTRSEATIIADLEAHGLDVPQLRDVLWGGHILVDDEDLYLRWRFPQTHLRISSHHPDIDKKRFPDLGLRGPLVREKLHGRTAHGTWVQLEKTPAAMGPGFHLPTFTDVKHIGDYVIYRLTRSNVGPWGLSKKTERRPVYLSPVLTSTVPVPHDAVAELTRTLHQVEGHDDTTSASPDLARRFPPPRRRDTFAELVFQPRGRNGRGLFGASDVYVHAAPRTAAHAALDDARADGATWSLPEPSQPRAATVRAGRREITCAVSRFPHVNDGRTP